MSITLLACVMSAIVLCGARVVNGGFMALERQVAERRYPTYKVRSCSYASLDQTCVDTAHSRAKEKPQQDGRRGKFTFRIKPHSHQRHSEGSNKPCAHQNPGTPQKVRQNCA